MSENLANAIIAHCETWASDAGVESIDFAYGVLYGAQRRSNKKDWHILRNIKDKLPSKAINLRPYNRWECQFVKNGIHVAVAIGIGVDWWRHLGGGTGLVGICVALIRACVAPGGIDKRDHSYVIPDLSEIVSMATMPMDFNASILQQSQLPWLFSLMAHFCDELTDA